VEGTVGGAKAIWQTSLVSWEPNWNTYFNRVKPTKRLLVEVEGQTITTFNRTPGDIFAMGIDAVDEILPEPGFSMSGGLQGKNRRNSCRCGPEQ